MKRAKQTPAGYQQIPANRIHINLSNPRHPPAHSEQQAIAELCDNEFIAELGADIANRGALNPLSPFGLVPMQGRAGHYISAEGNRRTCALIVITDPDRAPSRHHTALRRIAAKGSLPTTVPAYIFPTMDEAWQWVELQHHGAQGGVGRRDWNPTQKSRSAQHNPNATGRSNALAVAVLDRLETQGLLSSDDRAQASVSTLTRYLGSPDVRQALGLANHRELLYSHQADEVDKALIQLVLDTLHADEGGQPPAHSRSNKADRLQYANKLRRDGVAPTSMLDQPAAPAEIAQSGRAKRPSRLRSVNHPDTRRHLFPSDFAIPLADDTLRILHREGRTLVIVDFRFSANYILRALIERIMVLFARKRGVWSDKMTDQALTQACAKALCESGFKGSGLRNIQKAAGHQDTSWSLHSLGHAVHGGSTPTATDLRATFNNWRPALEVMLAQLSQSG